MSENCACVNAGNEHKNIIVQINRGFAFFIKCGLRSLIALDLFYKSNFLRKISKSFS
jgi:hypothetical protein